VKLKFKNADVIIAFLASLMIEFQIINNLSILALKNRYLSKKELWKNIRTSLRYVLICDGVNGYLCCFVLTTSCITWESREMQSSTLPGKNHFMEKLTQKVTFILLEILKKTWFYYPKQHFGMKKMIKGKFWTPFKIYSRLMTSSLNTKTDI